MANSKILTAEQPVHWNMHTMTGVSINWVKP